MNIRKRELEEEKLVVQRQMEKKDSEINDLNTKLNEKLAEIQGLKSDKQVLDQQTVCTSSECFRLSHHVFQRFL
jgi:predicted RNase H-like nuclease (RuvC/YqgF family)